MSNRDLFLHEQLMLLSLHDRKGTVVADATYPYAIGGAVLTELLMSNRVRVDPDDKKRRVEVVDATPLGNELVDEWLAVMAEREKPRTLQDWVGRIAHSKRLKHRIAAGLARRGILRTTEDKVLWIFSRRIYPELDPRPERELIGRLRAAIFENADVDARTAVLLAVAHHGGVLGAVFDKGDLKAHSDRIGSIAEGEATAEATREAIEAMQAAVMVATTVPTIAATTVVTT